MKKVDLVHNVLYPRFIYEGQTIKSAYQFDESTVLFKKSSNKPSISNKRYGVKTWYFTFSVVNLDLLRNISGKYEVRWFFTCVHETATSGSPLKCLLSHEKLEHCVNFRSTEDEKLTVRYIPGCRLRVWGSVNTVDHPLIIPAYKSK
jgi:hypothetical protein